MCSLFETGVSLYSLGWPVPFANYRRLGKKGSVVKNEYYFPGDPSLVAAI